MRKSIFIGVKDIWARSIKQEVGARANIPVCCGQPGSYLRGDVAAVYKMEHGTLIVIKNADYKMEHGTLYGWDFIPLWVTDCGGSGVLNRAEEDHPLLMDKATKSYRQQVARMEREAQNCMAL